jgi:hypothetical protein
MAEHVSVTGDAVVAKNTHDAPFAVPDFRHDGAVAHEMFQAATSQVSTVPRNDLLCARTCAGDVLLEEPFGNGANVAVWVETVRKAAHKINRELDVVPSDTRLRRDWADV